jgi:hypothetical protein
MDEHVQADFEAIAEHISHLPPEIMQRHTEAVARYRQEMDTLLNNLDAIEAATDNEQRRTSIEKALKHLKPLQTQGKHAPFDPNQLPFNIPKGEVRSPIEDEKELKKRFSTTKVAMVAQAPDSTDLEPTEDVQITPEIEALASELEHNPVKIYNWVHDNIQFIPTYGSIQGSQMTLETKSGNAFDTASLLIALLRASEIHARYAYGTVRIPINQAMNWVGGVTSPEAAMQLFAQGGIPTAGLAQGGSIKFLKLEHIWVSAWIDFFPSRGAIHKTGDSWVPMDASFKQYQFTEGMDIQGNVPFDAEGFVDQIINTAQINEDEGWVSGIDQTFMETTLQNYQTQMEAYINDTNPDATVGDVLGTQNIIPSNRPILAGSLPYPVMAKGGTFQEIPSNLRKEFQFNLYASDMDRMLENPVFSLKRSLPDLAGKRLTLSFEPASEADRQVIESYLPEVPEGEELDPNDLPSSLPGYLINLKAQFKIDGEIVAESGGFKMGQELSSTTGISRLTGDWHLATNRPIAGEFYAFGLDLQGISAKQLETVTDRMESVKAQLEAQQFEGLTKDGLVGDMLYAGALSYFAANDLNLKLLNRVGQALAYRQPSFGTFSTNLIPVYSFGVPRQVKMSGILVDMDAVAQSLWAKNNDAEISRTVGQQVGVISSAWEHRIPELLFTDDEHPGEAVSAVKALAIASAEGQRIYQVTQENVNAVLPVLNISTEVKDEIRAAVAVGQVATVSQDNISVGGWTGVGYVIADPETGAGAYRISGGSNGGWFWSALAGIFVGLGILFSAIMANPLIGEAIIPGLSIFITFLGLGIATVMQGSTYAERFNLASLFLGGLDVIMVLGGSAGILTISASIIITLTLVTFAVALLANALAFIILPLKPFFVVSTNECRFLFEAISHSS